MCLTTIPPLPFLPFFDLGPNYIGQGRHRREFQRVIESSIAESNVSFSETRVLFGHAFPTMESLCRATPQSKPLAPKFVS